MSTIARLQPFFAVSIGLALGLIVAFVAGENPLFVAKILMLSGFKSEYDLGLLLYYLTCFGLSGLSVSIAFKVGLFNIGAEGQLLMGAIAAAAIGHYVSIGSSALGLLIVFAAAVIAGGAWACIPAWLKNRFGSHEVINTIMLNFVASGLTSYLTLKVLKNPESQNPETIPISDAMNIRNWDPVVLWLSDSPASILVLILPVSLIFYGVLLNRTVIGFEIRATGINESAARSSGIDTNRMRIASMILAGGFAGLIGLVEVIGNSGRFKMGFSPDFGFVGIAIALLSRANPIGIFFSALLFSILHKGAGDLDLETKFLTRDITWMFQSFIIFAVSVDGLWGYILKNWRPKTNE